MIGSGKSEPAPLIRSNPDIVPGPSQCYSSPAVNPQCSCLMSVSLSCSPHHRHTRPDKSWFRGWKNKQRSEVTGR